MMKKQIKITIDNKAPIVIDEVGDECWSVIFNTSAQDLIKTEPKHAEPKPPTLKVDGLRWRRGEHYHLGWEQFEVGESSKITIECGKSNFPVTCLEKEEMYIQPEEECSFCFRKKSEVKHLIKGGFFSYICDTCIDLCSNLVERERRGG